MADTATYVYCVVQRAKRPSVARSLQTLPEGSRPSLIELGRARWAVVADVPLARYGESALASGIRDLEWVSRVALAHEAVVEHFTRGRGSTVVPLKLFTLFSTPERLISDLRSQAVRIAAMIGRIRGAREWGVRVLRTQPAKRVTTGTRAVRSGAAFLEAKKEARDAARAAAEHARDTAERAFGQLSKLALETRRRDDIPDGATTPPLLDAAFLVAAKRTAAFRAAARRASSDCRRAGALLNLTGPWPAYSFVGSGVTG